MPVNTKPLINGRAYDWSSITLLIGGVYIVGVTKINYSDKQDKVNRYGAGSVPIARGNGNYSATCSITIYADEVEALTKAAPGKKLQDMGAFDITVQFTPEGLTGITTHVIRNAEFTGNQRSMNQGDTAFEVELELVISHIDWGKA